MNDKPDDLEKLHASEVRYRSLAEMSSDWFWETDKDHRFTYLSIEKTLGRNTERSAILGKTRKEASPDSMTAQEWSIHDQILAARRPFQRMQTRTFDHVTGEVSRFFSLTGRPMFDVNGEFIGYRGIGRDVTSIKRAERAIAESEARFRLITQNMRDIIVLMALDGRTLYLSPSFTRVTGHDVDASLHAEVDSFFHPDDLQWLHEEFVRCASGVNGDRPGALTYRFRHADGHHIWLEGQLLLVRDEHGDPKHVQISARDVTLRRQAEIAVEAKTRELKEANTALEIEVRNRQELERNILLTIEKALEQVGLELHDELGQDLTGIALLTKTLAQRLADKNPDEAILASKISALVNRTIGHTRMIAHGLSPYIWGDNGLVSALRQLASDVNSLDAVKCDTRMPMTVTINDEVVALSLYRIAQEAVNNALKHSKAGKIRITLTNTKRGIELLVSDDGIGHAPADTVASDQNAFRSIRHRCVAIDAALVIGRGEHGGSTIRVTWRDMTLGKPPLPSTKSNG